MASVMATMTVIGEVDEAPNPLLRETYDGKEEAIRLYSRSFVHAHTLMLNLAQHLAEHGVEYTMTLTELEEDPEEDPEGEDEALPE